MFAGLATGMATGRGQLTGANAWVANVLLLVQFPVIHSFLLTPRGRRLLAALVPTRHARELTPTAYTTLTAIQLATLFGGWSPSGVSVVQLPAWLAWVFGATFLGAWGLLLKSMWDAGISLQTGSLGWSALYRGSAPKYPGLPTGGLFRLCRQPIYLSFAVITWCGPAWTADKLLVASLLSTYCVIAPRLKERRFVRVYGGEFLAYRQRVPYLVPRLTALFGRD